MSQRVFSTEELVGDLRKCEPEVEIEKYQPEGVIIADVVGEMWVKEKEAEYTAAEERRAIAAGAAQVKAEAFDEVLREIYSRFGYAPRVWEEAELCR